MFRILSATFVLWVCLRGAALADVLYTIEELLPLPGFPIAHAYSVNDSGQVVGYSYLPATYLPGTVIVDEPAQMAPMFWYGGTATALAAPSASTVYIANDINNSGQIVGQVHGCDVTNCPQPLDDNGFISNSLGSGDWATVAPGSLASVPLLLPGVPQCYQDDFLTTISDTGYMLSLGGGISSPNMSTDPCGLDVSVLYESGLALTDIGYVYDAFVGSDRQWVVVPSCSGDLAGYTFFGSVEVSDQISQSICDLISESIHDKVTNASGQFILNIGNQAFLYTPVPEPTTLAILTLALAGLGISRRRPVLP